MVTSLENFRGVTFKIERRKKQRWLISSIGVSLILGSLSSKINTVWDIFFREYSHHQYLNRDFCSVTQQNSSKLIKTITLLVCASGVAWFGFSLLGKYQQVQQLKQGDRLLEKGEYSLAIEAYDRLLTGNLDKDHLIWINRGYSFLGLNQYQEMLQSCSTATLIEPNAALGWNCQFIA